MGARIKRADFSALSRVGLTRGLVLRVLSKHIKLGRCLWQIMISYGLRTYPVGNDGQQIRSFGEPCGQSHFSADWRAAGRNARAAPVVGAGVVDVPALNLSRSEARDRIVGIRVDIIAVARALRNAVEP